MLRRELSAHSVRKSSHLLSNLSLLVNRTPRNPNLLLLLLLLLLFLQKYFNVFIQKYFRNLFAMKEFISQMNYFLCSGLRGRCAEKATWKYKETYITITKVRKIWNYFIKIACLPFNLFDPSVRWCKSVHYGQQTTLITCVKTHWLWSATWSWNFCMIQQISQSSWISK